MKVRFQADADLNEDGRILVTHDRRTMPIHFGQFVEHYQSPGLIVISQKTDVLSAIEDLILIWAASDAEEYVNRILTIPI